MVIPERRMFLCMVVICQRIQRKHEFSLSYLVKFVHTLTFMIRDSAIKSQKKPQPELQRLMNSSLQTSSQWKALFVATTSDQMQEIILLENNLNVSDEIYAELYSYMKTLLCL